MLLTGGTGFVGANLARRLLSDGHDVHLLVRPGFRPWRLEGIRDQVRLHEVRPGDREALGALVSEVRAEWVFHLAVYGGYAPQTDLHEMLETNVRGTVLLLEACRRTGFEAFVNTGSSSEYGYADHPPAETDRLEPNSDYAVTKAFATQFCRSAAQRDDLPVTTLRLYSVFGPWEEPTRLLPTLIARGREGALPPLVDPDTARDFVYVDDVCDACIAAASHPPAEPGAIYNVGTGVQTTIRDVVNVARRVLGIAAEPSWGTLPRRPWDTTKWVADIRRIRRELLWEPRYSFEEGFREMARWTAGAGP